MTLEKTLYLHKLKDSDPDSLVGTSLFISFSVEIPIGLYRINIENGAENVGTIDIYASQKVGVSAFKSGKSSILDGKLEKISAYTVVERTMFDSVDDFREYCRTRPNTLYLYYFDVL
jgi:hypothetical protein